MKKLINSFMIIGIGVQAPMAHSFNDTSSKEKAALTSVLTLTDERPPTKEEMKSVEKRDAIELAVEFLVIEQPSVRASVVAQHLGDRKDVDGWLWNDSNALGKLGVQIAERAEKTLNTSGGSVDRTTFNERIAALESALNKVNGDLSSQNYKAIVYASAAIGVVASLALGKYWAGRTTEIIPALIMTPIAGIVITSGATAGGLLVAGAKYGYDHFAKDPIDLNPGTEELLLKK